MAIKRTIGVGATSVITAPAITFLGSAPAMVADLPTTSPAAATVRPAELAAFAQPMNSR